MDELIALLRVVGEWAKCLTAVIGLFELLRKLPRKRK
jgi:hypothetical protein